jgi:hypothetical protein
MDKDFTKGLIMGMKFVAWVVVFISIFIINYKLDMLLGYK